MTVNGARSTSSGRMVHALRLIAIAAAIGLADQAGAQGPIVERIDVRIAEVEVVVTDRESLGT